MDNPFIGMIAVFGFDYAPQDWQHAAGQLMPIQQYQALFALLGVRYGGSPQINFNLPDLQGRTMIGQGTSQQRETYQIAQFGGSTTTTLTESQMPAHTHTATFTPGGAGSAVSVEASQTPGKVIVPTEGDYISTCSSSSGPSAIKNFVSPADKGTTVALGGVTGGGGAGGTVTLGATGGGKAFNNMPPFLVLNPCIAINGIFPMRPN